MAVPAAVAVPSMPLLPATSMQNPRPVVLPPVSTAVVATPPPPKAVAVPAVQTVPVPVPVPVQVEQTVAMPHSLLTRINTVVATMENELEDDTYCRALQDENQNLSSALKLNEEAMAEIAELRRREVVMKNELVQARAEVTNLEARLQQETSALNSQIGSSRQRLLQSQEAEALAEREMAQARSIESQLKVQIAELQRTIDTMRSDSEGKDAWAEELKRERDELRRAKEAAERQMQQEYSKVESLERQLSDTKKIKDDVMTQLSDKQRHIDTLERQLQDAQRQLDALSAQAAQAQRQSKTLSEELEKTQLGTRSFYDQLALKDKEIRDLEAAKAQLEMVERDLNRDKLVMVREIDELKEQVITLQRLSQVQVQERVVTAPARTSVVQHKRSSIQVTLLPESRDPFVVKVREAMTRAEESMLKADEAHAATWQAIHRTGGQTDIVLRETDLERRAALDSLAACEHDLKALYDEVFIEHQLTLQEQEVLKAAIQQEIDRADAEKELLQRGNPMEGLHEDARAILTLADANHQSVQWDKGFTVMHYAAQAKRRDLLTYLVKSPTWQPLLNKRDEYGRLPVAYARSKSVADFLRREGSYGRPVETTIAIPQVEAGWEGAVRQVEDNGFYSVPWSDGYTLLHLAAETGNAELATWCLEHYADPNAPDSQGRTPMALAQSYGNYHVTAVMQKHMEPSLRMIQSGSIAKRSVTFGDTGTPGRSSMAAEHTTKLTTIPQSIANTMRVVDERGWDKMDWKQGYTLLHWAAKHDMADLCDRFMYQRANPNVQDADGRTPLDIARSHQSFAALHQLERGPSDFLREPDTRHISSTARASVFPIHRKSLAAP